MDQGDSDIPPQAEQPADLPHTIGGYKILRQIGAGGMASVYAAMQKHPRRTVALKVIKADVNSDLAQRRFKREIEILGKLRHQNIAQVYDSGVHHDPQGVDPPVPFFVMEYVPRASTIIDYADDRELDLRQRIKLFIKVCAAIDHGHRHKILHRDIKPNNILIDERGEVKVIDYGVAQAAHLEITDFSVDDEHGRLIGTIQYISPEQVSETPCDLDARCDVYSLGSLLFRLLTGALPHRFEGKPLRDVVNMVRQDPPIPPSQIRPELRGDLEAIMLKSLAKDRRHRYRNAGSFGRELLRYLNYQPVHARQAKLMNRLGLFIRRHRTVLIAGGTVAIVMSIASAIVLVAALSNSNNNEQEIRPNIIRNETDPPQQQPPVQVNVTSETDYEETTFTLSAQSGAITTLTVDPSGQYLISAAEDNSMIVWDMTSREAIHRLNEHDHPPQHICINADGNTFVSAASDGTMAVLTLEEGNIVRRLRYQGNEVRCLAINPDGTDIAYATDDLTVRVESVPRTHSQLVLRGTHGHFTSLAYSFNGEFLIAGTQQGAVYVWSAQSGILLHELTGLTGLIEGVGFNHEWRTIYAAARNGTAMRWELEPEVTGRPFLACPEPIQHISIDPYGKRMICASPRSITFRDLQMNELLREGLKIEEPVFSVALCPEEDWFAVGNRNGEVRVLPLSVETIE